MLCRFYGWSPEIVNNLGIDEFEEFKYAMFEIQSREYLEKLRAQDWSSMKDEARTRHWNDVKKIAYPQEVKKGQGMSNADLAAWLKGSLGG